MDMLLVTGSSFSFCSGGGGGGGGGTVVFEAATAPCLTDLYLENLGMGVGAMSADMASDQGTSHKECSVVLCWWHRRSCSRNDHCQYLIPDGKENRNKTRRKCRSNFPSRHKGRHARPHVAEGGLQIAAM